MLRIFGHGQILRAARARCWMPLLVVAMQAVATSRARELETPEKKPLAPSNHSTALAAKLTPLIKVHKGRVAVAVKHLGTGESFYYNADEVMPTASLIKFPVMIETYRQAAAGKVNLDAWLTLKKADKVPGAGVLTYHFSEGATLKLRDAVRLMIAFSDNTATNMVLDAIGIGSTAATMEATGYPNTKIHSKVFRRDTSVFPDRSKKFGLGSTTAAEMIRLCEALQRKSLVNTQSSEGMLEHMRACDDNEKFPRFLPPGTKLAFKTGSLADTRTAAGIIECESGPVALCVLSCDNEDKRWVRENSGNVLCAEIAREVHAYFKAATGSEPVEKPSPADKESQPARAQTPAVGGTRPKS